MKSKSIGILIIVALLFSIADTINYMIFISNKGYSFYEIISFKELYLYFSSVSGLCLTVLSLSPWLIIYLVVKYKKI